MSLIQYAGTSEIAWKMSDHIGDLPGMLEKINGMRKIQGITNTYSVMIRALDIELKEEDAGRREDVPLVILLITDGRTKVSFCDVLYLGRCKSLKPDNFSALFLT